MLKHYIDVPGKGRSKPRIPPLDPPMSVDSLDLLKVHVYSGEYVRKRWDWSGADPGIVVKGAQRFMRQGVWGRP